MEFGLAISFASKLRRQGILLRPQVHRDSAELQAVADRINAIAKSQSCVSSSQIIQPARARELARLFTLN